MRTSTALWLFLLALTGLSFGLAEAGMPGNAVLLPVLGATLLKGGVVIDRFMALHDVAAPWRLALHGWLIAVLLSIAYAFHLSQT